jgi:hypothetical protein
LPYIKASGESKKAIFETLSALPASVKDRVFEGGVASYIVSTNQIAEKCVGSKAAKAYAGRNFPFPSCHKIENGTVNIYVRDNPADIRSGLVRAIGYYIAEVATRVDSTFPQKSITVVGSRDVSSNKKWKNDLTVLFLQDILKNTKYNLSVFKGMLHTNILKARSGSELSKQWNDLSGLHALAKAQFIDYVYAETIDSYYCSVNSRETVRKDFPGVARLLGLSNNEKKNNSFGLASAFQLQSSSTKKPRLPTYSGPDLSALPTQQARDLFQKSQAMVAPGASHFKKYNDNQYFLVTEDGKNTGLMMTNTGGQWKVNKPTYYNPNTRSAFSADELNSFKEMYGTDFLQGVVSRSGDGLEYSGYADGGRYESIGDNKFVYKSADNQFGGRIATLKDGKWEYEDSNWATPEAAEKYGFAGENGAMQFYNSMGGMKPQDYNDQMGIKNPQQEIVQKQELPTWATELSEHTGMTPEDAYNSTGGMRPTDTYGGEQLTPTWADEMVKDGYGTGDPKTTASQFGYMPPTDSYGGKTYGPQPQDVSTEPGGLAQKPPSWTESSEQQQKLPTWANELADYTGGTPEDAYNSNGGIRPTDTYGGEQLTPTWADDMVNDGYGAGDAKTTASQFGYMPPTDSYGGKTYGSQPQVEAVAQQQPLPTWANELAGYTGGTPEDAYNSNGGIRPTDTYGGEQLTPTWADDMVNDGYGAGDAKTTASQFGYMPPTDSYGGQQYGSTAETFFDSSTPTPTPTSNQGFVNPPQGEPGGLGGPTSFQQPEMDTSSLENIQ